MKFNKPQIENATEDYPNGISLSFRDTILLERKKSQYQFIEIYEHSEMGKLLFINKMIMFSEKDYKNNREMMVNISCHCRPTFENILIIGGGDGSSPGEALKYDYVTKIDVVEVDPMVTELCKKHFTFLHKSFSDNKVIYHYIEGAEYVEKQIMTKNRKYGIIIISPTDPDTLSLSLFQKLFFKNCNTILDENGILCIGGFSPYYSLGKLSPTEALKNLSSAFPIVEKFVASVPTYPGGCCVYLIASKKYLPADIYHKPLTDKQYKEMDYYNFDAHKSAFLLPNVVKRMFLMDMNG